MPSYGKSVTHDYIRHSTTLLGFMCSIVVYQFGPRHNYLIPKMLDNAGLLTRLITSGSYNGISRHKIICRLLRRLTPRITNRNIPLDACRIKSYFCWDLAKLFIGILSNKFTYQHYVRIRDILLRFIVKATIPPQGTMVYVMQEELYGSINLFVVNHNPIIVDIYLHPFAHRLMAEHKSLNHAKLTPAELHSNLYEKRLRIVCQAAYRIICPSTYVANGVAELDSSFAHKTFICPYGYSGN